MNLELFDPLIDLFNEIDYVYEQTAAKYGFICRGCENNCCTSLFFHHTFVEKAYLQEGFSNIDLDLKTRILEKAEYYIDKVVSKPRDLDFQKHKEVESSKLMCPLNEGGQCLLYSYRPMICRFHGLPHVLKLPGCQEIRFPGCAAGNFDKYPYYTFDRTSFYHSMTKVEMSFRKTTCKAGKIKMTIAEMLLNR